MQHTFRIEQKFKRAVFKSWLFHGCIVLGSGLVFGYFLQKKFSFEPFIVGFSLAILFIYLFPGVILYFKYYNRNRETEITIDLGREELHVKDQGREYMVKFSQIYAVHRIWMVGDEITSFWKPRFPFAWDEFGFLRVVVPGQPDLILTSLMIDIGHPPLSPDREIYRIFPVSFAAEIAHMKALGEYPGENEVRARINFFKRKFKDLDEASLKCKRVENGFCEEAEIAAEELLNEIKRK